MPTIVTTVAKLHLHQQQHTYATHIKMSNIYYQYPEAAGNSEQLHRDNHGSVDPRQAVPVDIYDLHWYHCHPLVTSSAVLEGRGIACHVHDKLKTLGFFNGEMPQGYCLNTKSRQVGFRGRCALHAHG